MPAVSFYLKEKVLESVRAKAAASNAPVSQIILKTAVETTEGTEITENT